MLKKILICMSFALFFWGCSQAPKPAAHKFTYQTKIETSEHWNIFAKDIGLNVAEAIKQENISNSSITFLPNNNSSFCRAFRSFLGTYLLKSGIDIKEVDMADYQLDWSVQAVKNEGESVPTYDVPPGSFTFLAVLGYGVYKIFDNSSSAANVIALGIALDIIKEVIEYNSIPLPKNEVIINVSLKKSGEYKYRSTNIYYVNDLDTNHYYKTKDRLGIDKKFNQKTFNVSN